MGTILDYLREYGDYTLEEKPLNEVDSLALCQFSYLKFDGIAPAVGEERPAVDLRTVAAHARYEELYADERYRKDNTALFQRMLESRRFRDMRIYNYVNQIKLETETQFAAMTFRLADGTCYVAYRGTDETIVGWKEDLNLAFSEPTEGQLMSVAYLERAAQDIDGDFCVGGHSKGGNLSVYAAMNCAPEVRARIGTIYDHDGPGFRPEVKAKGAYGEIEGRIRKTIPHSSLVGMILYSDGRYEVVESRTLGLAQHNPYTWLVDDDRFRSAGGLYASRRFLDEALNEWILSLTQEQVHTFVDTLYRVLLASETDNLIDLTAHWLQSVQKIGTALKEIDPQTGRAIIQIMRSLFEIASANAKTMFRNKTELRRERFDEGIRQLEQLFTRQTPDG